MGLLYLIEKTKAQVLNSRSTSMRLSVRAWIFLCLGFGILVAIGIIFAHEATFVGFTDPAIVDTAKSPVQELWFTPGPDASLMVVSYPSPPPPQCRDEVQSLVMTIWRVSPSNPDRVETRILDFGQILGSVTPLPTGLRVNLPAGDDEELALSGNCGPPTEEAGQAPPDRLLYSISEDGKVIAWFRGEVNIGSIEKLAAGQASPRLRIPFLGEVRSLVLSEGGSLVSLLDSNLKLTTYKGVEETPWNLELPAGNWQLTSRGPIIGAINLDDGKTGIVRLSPEGFRSDREDLEKVRWFENKVRSSPRSTTVAGDGNLLAVGNLVGLVTITEFARRGAIKSSLPLPPGGRVRAIALLPGGEAVAAGDFPGIYLVAKRRIARLGAFTPPGVRLIAANGKHLAYATGRQVVLMRQTFSIRLTDSGKYGIGICFGLLGLLGFLRACLADKDEKKDPSPEVFPKMDSDPP